MRAPEARRHGPGDRLQRRSRRAGAPFQDQGFDWLHVVDLDGALPAKAATATPSTRSLPPPTNPVAARRRHPHAGAHRRLARQRASPGSFSARWPCAIRTWSRPPAQFPAGSPSASTRAAARLRSRAGRKRPTDRRRSGRTFEDAGVAAIIYTDIDRDGVLTGLNIGCHAAPGRSAVAIPVIASGGLASIDDIKRLTDARLRYARRRDFRPRAL